MKSSKDFVQTDPPPMLYLVCHLVEKAIKYNVQAFICLSTAKRSSLTASDNNKRDIYKRGNKKSNSNNGQTNRQHKNTRGIQDEQQQNKQNLLCGRGSIDSGH